MLRTMGWLRDMRVRTTDGSSGVLKDIYVNDAHWYVSHLVIQAGTWPLRRRAVITPTSVSRVTWRDVEISLTRREIKHRSREPGPKLAGGQGRKVMGRGFGASSTAPLLWAGPIGPLGVASLNRLPETEAQMRVARQQRFPIENAHLLSAAHLAGYRVEAVDGPLGALADVVIEDEDWRVPLLIVETNDRLPAACVVLPTALVLRIGRNSRKVTIDVEREWLRDGPRLESPLRLDAQLEEDACAHYMLHTRISRRPAERREH